jgi:hypothetical protein
MAGIASSSSINTRPGPGGLGLYTRPGRAKSVRGRIRPAALHPSKMTLEILTLILLGRPVCALTAATVWWLLADQFIRLTEPR